MNPATANLLRAVAAVASYAQANATDSAGIRRLVVARGKAEAAWVQAGSPDLPSEEPKPAVIPRGVPMLRDVEDKDWTPTEQDVEFVRETDLAYLLDNGGDAPFWCPKSLATGAGVDALDRPGSIATINVPRWVLP